MASDPLLSAQRSLTRVAVAALVLVGGAALFARSLRPKSGARTVAPATATLSPVLRDETERLLERQFGRLATGGAPVCAIAEVGGEPAAGARRRVFVRAVCRELCLGDGGVASGTGAGFPAAISMVAHAGGWHVTGYESPTDAHFADDLNAIFPPATRQSLFSQESARAVEGRMAERIAARWPGQRWLGDGAAPGCPAAGG